jgi:endonuclease IV
MTRELLVGAHMSIAGGIHNAFAAAERVGCAAIQIFFEEFKPVERQASDGGKSRAVFSGPKEEWEYSGCGA